MQPPPEPADRRFPESLGLTIFEGVPRDVLSRITNEMIQEFEDDAVLLKQGGQPRFLFAILKGTVEIEAANVKGKSSYIGSRSAGAVLGEQAFVEQKEHSATVKAKGRVTALRLPSELVETLLNDPTFSRNLLRALSGKLRQATEQRADVIFERKLLFAHFASHVNPEVVSALLQSGDETGGPQRRFGYVMFTDIRGFTTISQSMSPTEIADSLGPYLEMIVSVVHESRGIVDKYIGDGVMAVWGHPALGVRTADDVIDAALEMIQRSKELTFGGQPLRLGIGVNARELFMGNVGNEEKRSFTVLGSPVNLAARYEGANIRRQMERPTA